MNQKYGETGDPKNLDFLLFIPGYLMSVILAIIAIIVILILFYLIPIFLNDYAEGIHPAIIFASEL